MKTDKKSRTHAARRIVEARDALGEEVRKMCNLSDGIEKSLQIKSQALFDEH